MFCWKDKRTWPGDCPGGKIEPDSEEARDLAIRLEQDYASFVAYHACRPTCVAPYYKDGLRIVPRSDLLSIALDIFASGRFPEITREDVLAAAEEVSGNDDPPMLCVALDDRTLINYYGHYLLYGSEYVIGIAAGLTRRYGHDYRQFLKSLGKPTVFEVELPSDWLSDEDRSYLAKCMSAAALDGDIVHETEFTVTLDRAVPPEFIRSHSHPRVICDPWPSSDRGIDSP